MSVVLTLLGRDLRARVHDRSALALGILAPLALMTVLHFVVQGPATQDLPVGYAAPQNAVASVIEHGPLAQLTADHTLHVRRFTDEAALRAAVVDGKVQAGLAVGQGDPPTLTVLTTSDAVVAGAILQAVAQQVVTTHNAVVRGVVTSRVLGRPLPPADVAGALQRQPGPSISEASGVKGIDYRTQTCSGIAAFFLFFTVQFGIFGLLEEKRTGTLPRLLAAPVAPWQVLLAKLLTSVVIGLVAMTTLVLVSAWLLGARWGSPGGVALLLVTGVLAATATATLVVGSVRTPEQAGAAQAMVALVLGVLGGSFFSLARAGGFAATLSTITPHHWITQGLIALSGGQAWTAALGPAGVLLGFALVLGVPGMLLAHRTVRP